MLTFQDMLAKSVENWPCTHWPTLHLCTSQAGFIVPKSSQKLTFLPSIYVIFEVLTPGPDPGICRHLKDHYQSHRLRLKLVSYSFRLYPSDNSCGSWTTRDTMKSTIHRILRRWLNESLRNVMFTFALVDTSSNELDWLTKLVDTTQ